MAALRQSADALQLVRRALCNMTVVVSFTRREMPDSYGMVRSRSDSIGTSDDAGMSGLRSFETREENHPITFGHISHSTRVLSQSVEARSVDWCVRGLKRVIAEV